MNINSRVKLVVILHMGRGDFNVRLFDTHPHKVQKEKDEERIESTDQEFQVEKLGKLNLLTRGGSGMFITPIQVII